jgi:hypothetical protein
MRDPVTTMSASGAGVAAVVAGLAVGSAGGSVLCAITGEAASAKESAIAALLLLSKTRFLFMFLPP